MCHIFQFAEIRPTSTHNALVAAVLPTVLIFLVISILLFVIGFMSGIYVGRKCNKESSEGMPRHVTAIEHPHQIPFYEDVLSATVNQQEQNDYLELEENVAYQPTLKPTAAAVEIK